MGISHKNIYYESIKGIKDLKTKDDIEEVFKKHPAYGHRRIAIHLKANKKKIRRVMKKFSLKPPRLWYQKKYLTKPNNNYKNEFKNLIGGIKTPKINEIWSSDLTYLKCQNRFLYLSIIQDIATNEVIGCNIGDQHNSNLVLETIKEAALKYNRLPKIFHSDRGREYLNQSCIGYFKKCNIQISVSDPGSPWQNGHSESFFSRLKVETGDLQRFETPEELAEYIYQYIHYYNNERIIVRLKMSPIEYKKLRESVLEKRGT